MVGSLAIAAVTIVCPSPFDFFFEMAIGVGGGSVLSRALGPIWEKALRIPLAIKS
jgi:hypothetical protein